MIRLDPLDQNQNLLIEGFAACRSLEANIVTLDGHVIIDTAKGIEKISPAVFERLGITFMVHLEADAYQISINRTDDKVRKRPLYTLETLEEHQEVSREYAHSVANSLSIPYLSVRHGDEQLLAEKLRR